MNGPEWEVVILKMHTSGEKVHQVTYIEAHLWYISSST